MSSAHETRRQAGHGSHRGSQVFDQRRFDLGNKLRRDETAGRLLVRSLPDRTQLLDAAAAILKGAAHDLPRIRIALDEMITTLRDVRMRTTASEWSDWTLACRQHPILDLIHQDPFTRRAFEKPRGYAGDAPLLDMIYGREEMWPAPDCSVLGRSLFEYTTQSPAPEGVRARRAYVAKMIDRLADRSPGSHVLSIAAGHFREALLSSAVKRRKLGRIVALDADPESLAEVEKRYGSYGVEPFHASVRQLFGRRRTFHDFDFVYSTGLFDYLNQASGRRLAQRMFEMLKPGGRVLIANFLPGVRDVGYMEIFMDWNLIYRTRQEMMDLTLEIPQDQIQDIRVFAEDNQNIIFLEVTRAADA